MARRAKERARCSLSSEDCGWHFACWGSRECRIYLNSEAWGYKGHDILGLQKDLELCLGLYRDHFEMLSFELYRPVYILTTLYNPL